MSRFLACVLLAALPLAFGLGCGDDTRADDEGSGAEAAPLGLDGSTELFPGFEFDTGLQPEGSPVQASFQLAATGNMTVHTEAVASGSAKAPVLTGVPGSGLLEIRGGFALAGTLKVDIDGLPLDPYEGPIPGIENVMIEIDGETPFEPFAIGEAVVATAEIPPADLPGIPLPAGIPGTLVLSVAEGSFVEMSFTGTCAGIDGDTASHSGTVVRGGTLLIRPKVVIEVPLLGESVYEIPELAVDLALGEGAVVATGKVESFGVAPVQGDAQKGKCDGGGGEGGGSSTGNGGAGPSSSTDASSTDASSTDAGSTDASSTDASSTSDASSSTGSGGGGEPEYLMGLAIDGVEAELLGASENFWKTADDFVSIDTVVFRIPGDPRQIELMMWAPDGVGEGCPEGTYLTVWYFDGDQLDRQMESASGACGLVVEERSATHWSGYFSGPLFGVNGSVGEVDVDFSWDFTLP